MKESVKTLRKWTDSWVIGKTEYMWDGGSDEDLDAIHASIRTVLAALESANERADRAEAVLRVYADGKNWKSPKGSMALILWRPNQDFASTNLGYALARKALEDKQND